MAVDVRIRIANVPGPAGTLENNSGFTASGASTIKGNSTTLFQILQGDNTSLLKVDSLDAYSGFGTATEGAPRIFLGTRTSTGDDSAILIGRNLVGVDLRSHAIRDESFHTSTVSAASSAYAGIDLAATLNGAGAQEHLRGAQVRHAFAGAGTLGEMASFYSGPVVNSGTVSAVYGTRMTPPVVAGGATVTATYGHWVDTFGGGVGIAFYAQGNPSALLGALQIAGALTGVTSLTASSAVSGQSLAASGTLVAYPTNGVAISGTRGGSDYGTIEAVTASGASHKGLSLNPAGVAQVLVGGSGNPVFGTLFECVGSIGATTWLRSGSYTVGTVPSAATAGAGALIYVSNESGGAQPAFSDATDWRRVSDRAVIS